MKFGFLGLPRWAEAVTLGWSLRKHSANSGVNRIWLHTPFSLSLCPYCRFFTLSLGACSFETSSEGFYSVSGQANFTDKCWPPLRVWLLGLALTTQERLKPAASGNYAQSRCAVYKDENILALFCARSPGEGTMACRPTPSLHPFVQSWQGLAERPLVYQRGREILGQGANLTGCSHLALPEKGSLGATLCVNLGHPQQTAILSQKHSLRSVSRAKAFSAPGSPTGH